MTRVHVRPHFGLGMLLLQLSATSFTLLFRGLRGKKNFWRSHCQITSQKTSLKLWIADMIHEFCHGFVDKLAGLRTPFGVPGISDLVS